MKIYSRTGDKGKTSLYGGKRVEKCSPQVNAYGTIDELNSVLGIFIVYLPKDQLDFQHFFTDIQKDLFFIGSSLSGKKLDLSVIKKRIVEMEGVIDKLDYGLPKVKNFLLPGGGKAASFAHLARSIARRAEREVVSLSRKIEIDEQIIGYLNRLSDILFMVARYLNRKDNITEEVWKQ